MNPNEYDDEQFTRYSMAVQEAIGGLWEAGASLDDLQSEVENAIENAGGPAVSVSIHAR